MPNLSGYNLPPKGACLELICIQNKSNVCFQHIFNICHSLINYSRKEAYIFNHQHFVFPVSDEEMGGQWVCREKLIECKSDTNIK